MFQTLKKGRHIDAKHLSAAFDQECLGWERQADVEHLIKQRLNVLSTSGRSRCQPEVQKINSMRCTGLAGAGRIAGVVFLRILTAASASDEA